MNVGSFVDLDLSGGDPTRPKYEKLKQYLVQQVTSGGLKPGQALPSEQRLAESTRVARNTVRQALSELEEDGLIRRVPGRGTFVNDDARRRIVSDIGMVALVVPDMEESYIQSVLRGFEGQAKEKQQQVIVCCVDEDVNKQANAFMQLVDRGIGGIALWPTIQVDTPPFQIRQLQDRGVPIVLCHRPVPGAKVPLITVSYRDIGRMAGKKMMAQGHRRIAYFASHGSLATQAHLEGLHAVVEPAGGSCPDEFIYTGTSLHWDISLQEGEIREALQRMAQHPDPPTAIMCAFDTICEQLYMILQGMGYRIPDDISLVGVGDTRRDGAIIRQLSSITIDAAELGRRTAQTLQEMQTGMRPLNDDKTECLPLGFIEGRTLGPPRG